MANNFPKFHGITLAAGGVIENLNIERLAADPVPVVAGRIWFNNTDKALKFSSLDGTGAVVVQVAATGADLASALAQLSALDGRVSAVEGAYVKKDGSVAFTGNVDAGGNRVTNVAAPTADTDAVNRLFVTNAISALGNAFEYVGTVDGAATSGTATDLGALAKTHAGAYYKVTTAGYVKLGAEVRQVIVNDGIIFNSAGGFDVVAGTESTVAGTANEITVTGSVATGFVVALDSVFSGRVTTLETGLANEITNRDTAIAAAIATEVTDRNAAITSAVAAEATARDAAITTAVSAEQSRATTAEGGLQSQIGTLTSLTTTDKTSLVAAVNEIKTLAGGGVDTLKAEINAGRKTFLATAPALTHVFAHGLNTAFPAVDTRVQGDDGVFRNDIVAFEETDANTITVFLTEARIIKISVEARDQLA